MSALTLFGVAPFPLSSGGKNCITYLATVHWQCRETAHTKNKEYLFIFWPVPFVFCLAILCVCFHFLASSELLLVYLFNLGRVTPCRSLKCPTAGVGARPGRGSTRLVALTFSHTTGKMPWLLCYPALRFQNHIFLCFCTKVIGKIKENFPSDAVGSMTAMGEDEG